MKRLFLLTLLGALAAHGAIKKHDAAPPAEKPADKTEKPAEKPADKPKPAEGGSLLDELLKRTPKGSGGKLEFKPGELQDLLRRELEKQGVPKEELKDANLFDLLKKLRERDPEGSKGLQFGGLEQMGDMLRFQTDRQRLEKLNSHFKQLLEGHRPGAAKAAPATFLVRDGKKQKETLALATAVQANGWLLTKASEVAKIADLQCQVKGEWRSAKVVRVWDDHDLALLKIDAKDLPVVQWATAAPGIGTFITAAAPQGEDPVAIGVVSVAARNLQAKGRGYLGVMPTGDKDGVTIGEVVPGGAASNAGVQKGDRILEIDGAKPDSIFTFTKIISDRKAGEKMKLKLQRGKEVIEKEILLGDRAAIPNQGRPGFDKLSGMGSTISQRKDNFLSVVQTDLPLEANQCGGPVTDLDGNVIGLVIARSGRIETLIIPSETLRKTLADVDFTKEETAAAKVEVKK
jgi:S1-C subfamily serine protease